VKGIHSERARDIFRLGERTVFLEEIQNLDDNATISLPLGGGRVMPGPCLAFSPTQPKTSNNLRSGVSKESGSPRTSNGGTIAIKEGPGGFVTKRPPLGTVVAMVARRGTWSEVSCVREERLEEGKREFQAWLMNTLSRRIRVGTFLLLDQVNWRSRRGSSINPRRLIVSLKMLASEAEKLALST
jgi:hypothetical protein